MHSQRLEMKSKEAVYETVPQRGRDFCKEDGGMRLIICVAVATASSQ